MPSYLAWDNDVFSIITYVIIHKTSSVYEGQATEFKFSAVLVGFSGSNCPSTQVAGCVFLSQAACCRRKKRFFSPRWRTGFCLPDLRRSTFADGLLPISTFADHPFANPTFADLDICRLELLPIYILQTSVRLLPLWTFAYQTFADWDFCLSDFCRSRLLPITRK